MNSDAPSSSTGNTGSQSLDLDWLTLSRSEEIIWWGNPSKKPLVWEAFPGVLLFILGIVGLFVDFGLPEMTYLSAIVAILGFLQALKVYFDKTTTYYILTTDRVVRKVGILRRDVLPIRYEEIEHARTTESLFERILGFGDIQIATAGTGTVETNLDDVTRPKYVSNLITQQKNKVFNSITRNP